MITVLLFASIREAIGSEQLILDKKDITIHQLREYLQQEYHLSSFQHAMTAINESFVTDEELVKEGDIVAFIPPVSGG